MRIETVLIVNEFLCRVIEMKSSGVSQLTPKTSSLLSEKQKSDSGSDSEIPSNKTSPPPNPKQGAKIARKKFRVIHPKYACQSCDFKTEDQAKFDRHIVVHDLDDENVGDKTGNDKNVQTKANLAGKAGTFNCGECQFQTEKCKELVEHLRSLHIHRYLEV